MIRSSNNFVQLSIDNNSSIGPITTTATAFPPLRFEFGALGTYMAKITVSATHQASSTQYTDSGTYTFHVGPIAELEVRDGGASAGLTADRYAITIAAANNGPDNALDAEVDIDLDLPAGVTVVRHIASDGTYSGRVWDLGALRHRDYRRAQGKPETATLTLILQGENAASATATARISNDNVSHPYRVVIDGTTHTGTVYDYNDENDEATLRARPGTTRPPRDAPRPPPSGSPVRSVPAAIVVEWSPVPTVNGWLVSHYELERSSWQAPVRVACAADVTTCQYVDITAETGQAYRYRVRAVNLPGVPGPWSRPMEIGRSITTGAPEAPALTANANGRAEIGLTWNKPIENGSSIISYTIEVADRGNGPWAVPDPAPTLGPDATSWTHEGLAGGTTKHYRILATNSQGDSPWSGVVSATTDAPIAPGAPVNLAAEAEGDTVIRLTWEAPEDDGASPILNYEAQWSADTPDWTADTARWRGVGRTRDGNTFSINHTGLKPGESIHYRVRARNSAGWGDWSDSITAHPPAGVPGAPVLTAQGHRATEIKLTWTKPVDRGSEITRYELQVSEDGGSSWSDVDDNISADALEYVHGGLTDGASRHYRIRAVNENGAGGWSQARSASTKAKAPGAVACPSESGN